MKNKIIISILVFSVFSGNNSFAGLVLSYHQLALKDLDEMSELVSLKLKESKRSSSGKIIPLREGLQAVFSRPNEDGMLAKVYLPLRNALERHEALEKAYKDLIDEALFALKNTKNFKPDVQVTYAIFLENLISEFKPSIKEVGFEKKMIEKIASSQVELSREALKERRRRSMKEVESPSKLADLVLKTANEEQKADEAKKASDEKKESESTIDKTVEPGKEFDEEKK